MGYIKQVGEDKYQLTVTLGTDINGVKRRKYKTVTAKSYEAAEAKMEDFEAKCLDSQTVGSTNLSFKDLVEMWRTDYASLYLKRSTVASYDRMLARHISDFNKMKLQSIKHRDIQRWINKLSREGLSSKSVKNYYALIHGIFKLAVQWEYLDKNPADGITLPRSDAKESQWYNETQVTALMEALNKLDIKEQKYKVGILLALFGGLRKGEICGLDVGDVDFEAGRVNIRQSRMVEVKNGVYTDTPKSARSIRTVSLPHSVMLEISRLIEYQEKERIEMQDVWQDSNALLKNEIGAPLYPQVLYRWFKRFLKHNHLPDITLHSLRHTHVSMLIGSGETIDEVSTRVGHAQKTTTLNIYAHMFKQSDDVLASKLDEKYFNPSQ